MDLKRKLQMRKTLAYHVFCTRSTLPRGIFLVRICGLIEILKIHVMIARTDSLTVWDSFVVF